MSTVQSKVRSERTPSADTFDFDSKGDGIFLEYLFYLLFIQTSRTAQIPQSDVSTCLRHEAAGM